MSGTGLSSRMSQFGVEFGIMIFTKIADGAKGIFVKLMELGFGFLDTDDIRVCFF